jgi:uncharacterized protein with HEPN domain
MRDDRERLLDMLEAIQKIEQYARDETFSPLNEDLAEVWMIHHLQIIGEAHRGCLTSSGRNILRLPGAE